MAKGDKKNASNQSGGTFSDVTTQTTGQVSVDKLLEANQALIEALAIRRIEKEVTNNDGDAVVQVENVCGSSISLPVTDPRTGQGRVIYLEKRGDTAKLTIEQAQELREKCAHFFERGLISIPKVFEDGANVIRDPQAFIDGLTITTATTAIDAIDSLPVLFDLWNCVERARFTHLDKQGKVLTEIGTGNKTLPALREVEDVDPKILTAGVAIQRRIMALTGGIKASLDG